MKLIAYFTKALRLRLFKGMLHSQASKRNLDSSRSQLDQLKTAVQSTYKRLLNLPSHREHKNLVLEKEVKKQLQCSKCSVLGAENAQNLINTDQKVEKLATFHRKLLEELVRRCCRDATNNKELFLIDFGRSEINSTETIEKDAKEVSLSVHRINKKIVTHPIVGGSAKAYATAIKKMRIHSNQQGLKGIATVETSPTQPIRPKSNNIASMVLPVVNSYFLLRNQIIRLQNMLEEKCVEVDTANQTCKRLENDAKLLRDVLAETNSKRQYKIVGQVASTWKSLLHSKTNEKHEKIEEGDNDDLHFSRDLELKLAKKTKMLAKRNTEIEMLKVQNNKLVTELKQEKKKRKHQQLPPAPVVSPRPKILSVSEINLSNLQTKIKILTDQKEKCEVELKCARKQICDLEKNISLNKEAVQTALESSNTNTVWKDKFHVMEAKMKVAESKYEDLKNKMKDEVHTLQDANEKLKLKHKQANTKLNESITKYEQMISRDMKKVLVLTSEKEKYKGMYLELKNRIVVDEKDMVMKLSRSKAKTSLLEKQIESLKIEMTVLVKSTTSANSS